MMLNVCMVLKNQYQVHVVGGKSIFVPRSDHNMHMRTEILHLTMQIVSPDIFNDNLAQKLSDYLFI